MRERSRESDHSSRSSARPSSEKARFAALWFRCLASEPTTVETVYARLAEFYGEPHRHYHTLDHIQHCLREFDRAEALMEDPDAVELALWFHDAIYRPGASDNERRSAELFEQWSDGRAEPKFRRRVGDLIMITTHRELPSQADERFIVDIDLSGFGRSWDECEQDGRRIRAEYAHLSDEDYYPSQLRFLWSLQNRPSFFFTNFFRQRYERVACENVRRIIAELQARGYD
jgi:predicted metal-dependent HD superfamily phosphohydrolase